MELFTEEMFGGGPFGGMGGFGSIFNSRRRGPPRGEDTIHRLKVSLEELYMGKVTKLQLQKSTICSDCKGVGGYGEATRCGECRGRGITVTINQIGPGMVQQCQGKCSSCSGEGTIMDPSDRCRACEGRKTVPRNKLLEVTVEPGMKHNQKISFRGEGNQLPGVEPGNVIIIIQEKEHKMFTREGNDLFFQKTITLNEALCGFKFVIPHLDGRQLVVTHPPGQVVKPRDVKIITGEGMPCYEPKGQKGDLLIKFDVEFPVNYFAPEDKLQLVERLLGGRAPQPPLPEDHEEVNLEELEKMPDNDSHGDDSDDDDPRRGAHPGVQCAQQ